MAKTLLKIGGVAVLVLIARVIFVGWQISHPSEQNLVMPVGLVGMDTPEGQDRLARSTAKADYDNLHAHFKTQIYGSYCGVASSVAALNALGLGPVDQKSFLSEKTESIKATRWVMLSGMTLAQLGAFLTSHGARVDVQHAKDGMLAAFKTSAIESLKNPNDVLLINYHRKILKQKGGGHISPMAAYDEKSDSFLVLDTASYKYPATWIGADLLYAAMATEDTGGKQNRGYVLVTDSNVAPPTPGISDTGSTPVEPRIRRLASP